MYFVFYFEFRGELAIHLDMIKKNDISTMIKKFTNFLNKKFQLSKFANTNCPSQKAIVDLYFDYFIIVLVLLHSQFNFS